MKRPPERRLRVYQQWQGNERFFCWGHCVTGPSWKSGLGSLVLLIAPTVIFLVFVAPYMADRVSPAILSISCVLPLFCLAMLLLTACRDPGVLPRQEPDEEWLQGRKPRAKDVCVNGQRVTVRYNDTCHFYQPPRAHHCSVNDNCIERFDHHCPWVGTTIGKRNYRTFLLFIYGTSVYIAWTFGVSLGSLFVRHGELVAAQQAAGGSGGGGDSNSSSLWLQALSQSGASIALMIFTFIFFWFVCGLSGFHTWLVATNQTTYENFRYNHNQVPNPYNEGCLRNCASVWCRPIPPSKVQFRAFIDEAVKQPVELGFPEWSGQGSNASPVAAPPPPAGSGIGGGSTLRSEPVGMLAGGGVAQVLELNGGGGSKPSLLGRGGDHTAATVPIQGYDSVTEGSSELPISRSEGRSEGRGEIRAASQLAAAGAAGGGALAAAGAAAAASGGGGWGLPAGRSSPDAVVLAEDAVGIEMASATGGWQQQQQGGSRLAAAGPLAGGAAAQQQHHQQQQQHYGTLAPQQQLMQQPGAQQHHQQQQEGHQGNGDLGHASGRLTEYEDADGSASETEGWGPGGEGSAGVGGGSMLLSALSGVDAADSGGGLQR